ncbi:hypothetical protein [Halomonas llamarensis]|uniref:Major facilitator superfamily (MFS) profile domain-containing protein n=1 Tax=Halomonas llamarensis TaxID=2945104 RepID=A0ABT0STV5_9GAMM|nr:hypothetical protein [Halomonas llamarensis]MCL7930875.1 hypothetical protein [Halomonas llamarensis]
MFEFFGALVDSLAGYIGGLFSKDKVTALFSSLIIGFVFFAGYFLYEFFSPGDIYRKNVISLFFISLGVSFLVYLFLVFCVWYEKNK